MESLNPKTEAVEFDDEELAVILRARDEMLQNPQLLTYEELIAYLKQNEENEDEET